MTRVHIFALPRMVGPHASARRAMRGQVMVIFVLGAVVIVGVAGLVLDAGLGYMNRTTLQGAADTASQTGARILSADFQAGPTSAPYTLADLTGAVAGVLDGSGAGPTVAQNFTGMLVTGASVAGGTLCAASNSAPSPGTGQCIVCQFFPTTTSPYGLPICPASDLGGSGPLLMDGVEVVANNTNATPLLGLLGIQNSSQRANATSLFGLPEVSAPYTIWYDCFSTSPTLSPWAPQTGNPTIGDYVMYYNNKGGQNGYQNAAACGDSSDTDASFKGDIHPPTYPTPPIVPGWFNAAGGTDSGTLAPITAGTQFLLPFIDCLGTSSTFPFSASACPQAVQTSYCGPGLNFNPPPPQGHWDMCIVGYAWVQAVNDCNTGTSGTSTPCIGQLIDNPNLPANGFLCDPVGSPNPPCANVGGTGGAASYVVQLFKT